MPLDIEKIKSLIAVAAQAQLDELELSQNGVDVRIERYGYAANSARSMGDLAALPPIPVMPPSNEVAQEQASVALQILKAPMAGTFYRAVTPGGNPFVDAGDHVDAGTVVAVLESMKIMNEIESEQAGRIKRVLCNNGELVTAGQPLFEIEEC